MFIKQSVFEKQIKKAYKYHALRVYKSPHNDLIIGTPGWTLAIYKDFISKEVKGADEVNIIRRGGRYAI